MNAPAPAAIEALKSALGPSGWTEDPFIIAPWLREWRDRWAGHTPILLTPGDTAQVARAVAVCAQHRIAITPQGGNTGLVGGQIPFGEVLLSTRRLRAVRDVTPLDDAMTVEAGVTLLEARQAAAAADRVFPLSLAAEGTATIGGDELAIIAGPCAIESFDQVFSVAEAVAESGAKFFRASGVLRLARMRRYAARFAQLPIA